MCNFKLVQHSLFTWIYYSTWPTQKRAHAFSEHTFANSFKIVTKHIRHFGPLPLAWKIVQPSRKVFPCSTIFFLPTESCLYHKRWIIWKTLQRMRNELAPTDEKGSSSRRKGNPPPLPFQNDPILSKAGSQNITNTTPHTVVDFWQLKNESKVLKIHFFRSLGRSLSRRERD